MGKGPFPRQLYAGGHEAAAPPGGASCPVTRPAISACCSFRAQGLNKHPGTTEWACPSEDTAVSFQWWLMNEGLPWWLRW